MRNGGEDFDATRISLHTPASDANVRLHQLFDSCGFTGGNQKDGGTYVLNKVGVPKNDANQLEEYILKCQNI